MNKFKVYHVLSNFSEFTSGCFQVRINVPFIELGERGHDMQYVVKGDHSYNELDDADIIVYSRACGKDPFRSIWRHQTRGIPIVYDLDDDVWNIPEANPAHQSYERGKEQVTAICNEVDLVTVSTERLKEVVLEETEQENVVVIPNGLKLDNFKDFDVDNKQLKIGWSGGSNHFEDLNIILPVIKDLQEDYNFEFLVQGLTGNPWEADAYNCNNILNRGDLSDKEKAFQEEKLKCYNRLRKLDNFTHVPFYPPEMYPSVISQMNLDIGLIPIVGHKFDKSKSLIKYLEYTATGTCALASDREPYKDKVIHTTDNDKDSWYNAIKGLIGNDKLREKTVKEQKEQLFPKYGIKRVVDKYEEVFLDLLDK